MKKFNDYVAKTAKSVTFNERKQNIAFRTMGMIEAVGRMHKHAEQEGKRFPNALRDFEYQYTALSQLLEYNRPIIEPDENLTYTLPELTNQIFTLSSIVMKQLTGKGVSLKKNLDSIEKALVDLYVVYNRALSFNGGDGITREDVLKIEELH